MNTNEQKILMVANWKMNPGREEDARKISSEIKKGLKKIKQVEVVVCPSFVHLSAVSKQTNTENYALGAQDVAVSDEGASTGSISPAQLQDLGTKYCIVGHGEMRALGQTNKDISRKIELLLKRKIQPILCIGEHERDAKGGYLKTLALQLTESLGNTPKALVEKIVIAYEPLWAIGKKATRGAKPEEMEEISILIRRTISDLYGFKKLPRNIVLYGGSVGNKKDVQEMIEQGHAGGFLVGRASLSAKTFLPLVEEANRLAK
jgi:triosephosphate isomerase